MPIPLYRQILHLPKAMELAKTNDVVCYCRVSDFSQKRNGSLDKQKADTITRIREFGGNLLYVVDGVELGKGELQRRRYLKRAIMRCNESNAILCANDPNRLLRAKEFDRIKNRQAELTREEIKELFDYVRRYNARWVATILDPKLSPSELHSQAVKRGMKASKEKPGRRPSADFETRCKILLDRENGDSYQTIEDRYGVPRTTVRRLCNQYDNVESFIKSWGHIQ